MPPSENNDPQHWRDRAVQMRSLAVTMAGCNAAILPADLAAEYDQMAERAAIKANGKKPRSNGKPPEVRRGVDRGRDVRLDGIGQKKAPSAGRGPESARGSRGSGKGRR